MKLLLLTTCLLFLAITTSNYHSCSAFRTFKVANNTWVLDGSPIVLRSGSLHYSRVPPSLWNDRILRMKAMGLNAVQTYVPWNFHELDFEGSVVDFTGKRDLPRFVDLVRSNDMLLLLRAGPYICGEWDLGGLPARLLSHDPPIRLRTNDTYFMGEVTRWFDVLLPRLVGKLVRHGGPIVAAQIENEFGFFGNVTANPGDEDYLRRLVALHREHLGDDVVLYTTDNGGERMRAGSLPDASVVTLGDFGPFDVRPGEDNAALSSIRDQNAMNPEGLSPPMCTEHYTGWLVHWGEPMARKPTELLAQSVEYMLSMNMSVNLYMAHGGTNFGFWSGANSGEEVTFDITSYDYNAPIGEDGTHSIGSDGVDKYERLRRAFEIFSNEELPSEPQPPHIVSLGKVSFSKRSRIAFVPWIKANLFPVESNSTLAAEKLAQRFGFTLYSTILHGNGGVIDLIRVSDRAQVYVDGRLVKTVNRSDKDYVVDLTQTAAIDRSLDILVENMGRLNFGVHMYDPKGLPSGVTLNGQNVTGWKHYSMEMTSDQLESINTEKGCDDASCDIDGLDNTFYTGSFFLQEDKFSDGTYLDMTHFRKGYVWINSVNIGRYWTQQGPQLTLFVPGEYLYRGENTIVVMEIDGSVDAKYGVEFVSAPKWLKAEGGLSDQTGKGVMRLTRVWSLGLDWLAQSLVWFRFRL